MRTGIIGAVQVTGLILWSATVALPQGIITTIAGTDFVYPVQPLPALSAPLAVTTAVAFDARGNLYVAAPSDSLVLKLDQQGILTVVAGNGGHGFSGDGGPAASASLNYPSGVAVDATGNLFIADNFNNRVRKVTPGGIINTVAGNAVQGFSGDGGPATSASLNYPSGVAVDAAGNLFISESGNSRIRKLSTGGVINTVAGNGVPGFSGDGGPATSAALNFPRGLAVDAAGNLFIADEANHRVRKLTPDGVISTVAGNGAPGFLGDGGPATSAALLAPSGVAVDAAGNLFIADSDNNRIRKVTLDGAITTVAGNGVSGFSGDGGPATSASLNGPAGVAVDAAGNLFIADLNRVRKVSPGGIITTVAGSGASQFAGDGSLAAGAVLNAPVGLARDATGNLFIADSNNNRIRTITPNGIITTVAGNGAGTFSGDGGPATSASLSFPTGVAVDAAGNLFIADNFNNRIRKVTPAGIITTVAGTGSQNFSGDGGPATSASLYYPSSVAVDAAGNLFIAEFGNSRIRKVSANGVINTIAGKGVPIFSGDGGPGTSASLNPIDLTVDAAGNLFIADDNNNRIRKLTPDGIITTVAGTGVPDFSGDGGPATSAALHFPTAVAVDAVGNLLIADGGNNRIRKVTPDGIITTLAGNGLHGFSGDGGPATSAALNGPSGFALDAAGDLFIADYYNDRIRAVLSTPPSYQVAPTNFNLSRSEAAFPQTITLSPSVAGLSFTASSNVAWLSVTPSSGFMPSVLQVIVDLTILPLFGGQGTITITAPGAVPAAQTIQVSFPFVAGAPAPPPNSLAASSKSVSFALTQGASPSTERLTLSNQGSGSIGFTATFSTATGGDWLQVTPASGSLSAGSPAALTITASPGTLGVGTFNGAILLASSDTKQQLSIPATLAITAAPQKILLSQTGLTFTAVAQGGKPLPQSFGILNIGQGSMGWTAAATTLSSDSAWLAIDQGSGTVTQPFTDVSTVNVSVDPTGLSPGDYYGQIQVSSIASNSPQSVSVALSVLPPATPLPPELRPAGIIFTGLASATPGSQDVQIGNPAAQSTGYLSGVIGASFTIEPANATVQPNQPAILRVYPDFSKLAPGTILRGTITLQFSDGTPKTVSVLTVVAPDSAGSSSSPSAFAPRGASTACAPSQLFPVFTEFASSGSVPAGWPQTVTVKVVDDCGSPMTTGSVAASFTNGDPDLALNSLQNGTWTATWQPRNVNANAVTVTVTAQLPNSGPIGSAHVSTGLQGSKSLPVLSGGPLSPVTMTEGPLAPGDLVLIRGTNLADSRTVTTSAVPQLGGASVLVGGRVVNLFYADSGQVIGQMPLDLPLNTDQQIYVEHGSSLGLGVPLTVAPTHPAILAIYDVTGGTPVLVDNTHPAAAGDTVMIYCTGMGGVDQNRALLNPVAVSIGGQNAPPSYAGPALPDAYPPSGPPTLLGGLASTGLGGLYQVAVTVPNGLPVGPATVMVSSAGQSSQAGVNLSVAGPQ